MVIDPVCGMEVDEKTVRYDCEYEGRTYYFCSEGCRKTFAASPEEYLAQGEDD